MILTPLWLESVARNREALAARKGRQARCFSVILMLLVTATYAYLLCLASR